MPALISGTQALGEPRYPSLKGIMGARGKEIATLSLAEVKETGRHLGVTFNDVVLAVAAGGLRELSLRYDGHADRPLMATVPVSTDKSTERVTVNEIGGIMVSLPVHIDDPLERVGGKREEIVAGEEQRAVLAFLDDHDFRPLRQRPARRMS